MALLPQQIPRNQYIADGVTAMFTYSFLVLQNPDTTYSVAVYVYLPPALPNPSADIQAQGTAYTVQGAGITAGGTITFQMGHIPPMGAIVTIVRDLPYAIQTQFAAAQNLNGANLDSAFQTTMLCIQQLNAYILDLTLAFPFDSYLPHPNQSNILPLLTNVNNQIWISQNGFIVAAVLEENPDVSTLRSELANASPGTDGATLVGYYDNVNTNPTTVDAFLTYLQGLVDTNTANIATNTAAITANAKFYGAGIYLSMSQSITSPDTTLVAFDTVDFDPFGLFVLASNSFTIKKAGYYFFGCNVIVNVGIPATSAVSYLYLYKNGVLFKTIAQNIQGAAVPFSGFVYDLSAINDYYQLFYAVGGSNTNGIVGTITGSEFYIEFVGTT